MPDDMPCRNTIELNDYLRKQEEYEADAIEIDKIVDELVDEEVVCVTSKDMQTALEFCEEEWYELMDMQDIVVDSAPVKEVFMLARLAQTLKDKLTEEMRDVVRSKAANQYHDRY